jgi:hypothetical protein
MKKTKKLSVKEQLEYLAKLVDEAENNENIKSELALESRFLEWPINGFKGYKNKKRKL